MRLLSLLSLGLLVSCMEVRSFKGQKDSYTSSFLEILDQKGELLHETRVDFKNHRRQWISLKEVHPQFLKELVQIEDQRFWSHPGVDFLALIHALKNYPIRGASTITMQLASMLQHRRGRKGFREKIFQMVDALILDSSWSKKEILEAYINFISLKGDVQGLNAATYALFNKHALSLSFEERMILLALIPAPNQSSDLILSRACRYVRRLRKRYNCQELAVAMEKSHFSSPLIQRVADFSPHLAQKLSGQRGAVKTTLRKELQLEAQSILSLHTDSLSEQNVNDGAILIADRRSGKILAYVGSSGRSSKSALYDHIQGLRQAGSTLKPLLFYQAIANRIITMNTPLKDVPFSITQQGLTYRPENYHKGFTYKNIPAKFALASSLNIPAVRVIDYLGPDRFYNLLSDLDMRSLKPSEHYGHSMALGAVDITLWDLLRAYRTMAENGQFKELSYLPLDLPSKQIEGFNPETGHIISHILSEKDYRRYTFGLQSSLSTKSWSAVKTGTSKDMRDNWCVGYTDSYLIGVWIGNSNGDPMWNVTGVSGAAPIFHHLVEFLHQNRPSLAPKMPETLIQKEDNFYLSGTEPREVEFEKTEQSTLQKITYPQHGSQFAFDPEIPETRQRILFQGLRPGEWKLNGKILTTMEVEKGFLPSEKGKYRLELWEGDKKQDEISFFVKAGKKTGTH